MTTLTTSVRSDPAPAIPLRVGAGPEEIYAAYGLTCPPRIGTLRDPSRPTYGRAVARIMARLGLPPMPHQRYAADVALEVDPATGALAYRQVIVLIPRQSGKTSLILGVKVHRALAMGKEAYRYNPRQGPRQRILYAAQKRMDARDKFVDDHLPVLLSSPYSGRFRPRLTNGHEALIWDTGAYDGITANGETSGHGKVVDLAFEDEAFAATGWELEQAFSPAMITRWSPQHWVVSTEGTEKSVYLASKVDLGRQVAQSGLRSSICYLEWSNEDGPRDAPATWRTCIPALGHTVTEDTIGSELEKLASKPDEFDRAYLNRRRRHLPPPDTNVPTEHWPMRVDEASKPGPDVALAIDITPARDHASIGLVGPRADGRMHLELIAYGPGTDWVVERAAQLKARLNPVGIGLDAKGPAAALLVDLKAAGITVSDDRDKPCRGDLYILHAGEVAQACGMLADHIRHDKARHIDQEQLTGALFGARTRPLGDAWAWARRTAATDISPLVTVTEALFVYLTLFDVVVDDRPPELW